MSQSPALYVITDNGAPTTDAHLTERGALERLATMDARFPHHRHGVVPLYLHPAPARDARECATGAPR